MKHWINDEIVFMMIHEQFNKCVANLFFNFCYY